MKVFDIETDGLLDTLTTIHCITGIDTETGKAFRYNSGMYADGSFAPHDGSIEDGLKMLEEAPALCGHKIIWYDIPAIKKLFPRFNPKGTIFDTLVASQVIWTNLADRDHEAIRKKSMPWEFQKGGLIGKHSLEAWGWRLGEYKGDFNPANYKNPMTGEPHTWATIGFTQEMAEYADQDPVVTLKLLRKIESKNYSKACLDMEMEVSRIIFRQHERGVAFDDNTAMALTAKLKVRQAELADEAQRLYPPWYAPKMTKGSAEFTPKRDNKKEGYVGGAPLSKIKLVVFNPGSRDHIADRLQKMRGWKPSEFTADGAPKIDETVMEGLPWPEAKLLAEYLTVDKRLGQVAEGQQAWLKLAKRSGIYGRSTDGVLRIHGTVNTNGAVTGRMTHSNPNVTQAPKAEKHVPYGKECRECWIASPGLVLVGADASGLELRMLGHYMAKWDGGVYSEAVSHGRKEDGTDVHTLNRDALSMNSRDFAKTWIYAFLYGAGDYKLGLISLEDFTEEQKTRFYAKYKTKKQRAAAVKRLGGKRRKKILDRFPALKELVDKVKKAAERGYLVGLDGRHLHVRSPNAALNTLLQSAGAVVLKKALVYFDAELELIYRPAGLTAEPVINAHDETQTDTSPEIAEEVGQLFVRCITRAGEHFKIKCPLTGEYAVGANWAETH